MPRRNLNVLRGTPLGRSRTGDKRRVIYRTDPKGLMQLEINAPDWGAIKGRAKDLRPVWDRIRVTRYFHDAKRYQRPDRWVGGIGIPDRDGRRRNWGTGYKPRLRVTRTKRMLKLRFTRPYPPAPTVDTDLAVARMAARYIMTGEQALAKRP